jgi:hypothetical protein
MSVLVMGRLVGSLRDRCSAAPFVVILSEAKDLRLAAPRGSPGVGSPRYETILDEPEILRFAQDDTCGW